MLVVIYDRVSCLEIVESVGGPSVSLGMSMSRAVVWWETIGSVRSLEVD